MTMIYCKRDDATKHKVKDNAAKDTLAKIVAHYQGQGADYKLTDWKDLALYNWGTSVPQEVNRALMETVGCGKMDEADPSNTTLAPAKDASPEILVPKLFKKEALALNKRYTIKVKRQMPATAVRIKKLDPWFVPGLAGDECVIEYELEGLKDRADKLSMDIYGSNYCECTEWNNGLGKYEDPSKLAEEPIYTHVESKIEERKGQELKWAGDVTTTKGMLGRKTGTDKKRYINVAFSPYTVHFRYWKLQDDEKARLILEPFWPQWEDKEEKPDVLSPDILASPAKLNWTNKSDQQYGVLEVHDAAEQLVHHAVLEKAQLEKGAKELSWDKNYRANAMNGEFEKKFIDDSAEPTPLKKLLFKSTPYKTTIRTVPLKIKKDAFKIKWEIKNTSKLERGLLEIVDKEDHVVYRKALAKGDVAQKKHEHEWDGKFLPGVKNSRAKDTDPADKVYEAIPEDMPYRVRIEVHTAENQTAGLALAAMHTEVRLFVHKENYLPKDIRYDPLKAKPCLALAKGPLVPGDAPKLGDRTKWFRHQLAECGFHPGPVTDKPAADAEYKAALREFKRSVPANPTAAAGDFKRLRLNGGEDEKENLETENAIKDIRASDKRRWFGDLDKVLANDEDPDLTDDEIKTLLPDPEKDIVLWVDDRQYYTESSAKDENNNQFLTGSPAAETFGLNNYRGAMTNGDGKVDMDASAIARPWIPLQVDLPLLKRADKLDLDYAQDKVKISDEKVRNIMRRAIGPLRVDWSIDEVPMDLSTISTADYPDAAQVRTRKYVAWAIYNKKAVHTPKHTKRKTMFMNCPEDLGGIRPSDLSSYQQKAFSVGDLSLEPWRATADSTEDSETIATVVHDHLAASQKEKTDLFPGLIGTSGAYFHPSRIAGDGYQVRAEVRFKKFNNYEFPNLEVLEKRYPAPPQALSARLRIWRRGSMRGYAYWAPSDPGDWPGLLDGFRMIYRTAHVYFVHEGKAAKTFAMDKVFKEGENEHENRFKSLVANNVSTAWYKDKARMKLRSKDPWPWGHRDDFGCPNDKSALNASKADAKNIDKELLKNAHKQWRGYRAALLLALLREAEKQGYLRGHLFVQFKSTPKCYIVQYECDGAPSHKYWYLERDPETGSYLSRMDGEPCPAPGCTGDLDGKLAEPMNALPFAAVGISLGATWLFGTNGTSDNWAHEVGHHRHFQHAANAPGDEPPLHDSQNNSTQNWVTLGENVEKKKHWDRRCLMSYTKDKSRYPCGKCVLRNQGWKVEALGHPGPDVVEP